MYRTVLGHTAQTIGRTDHLPGLHASTSNQAAADLRPMIATGRLVDLRRSTEFAPRHHRYVLTQTSLVKIRDQRRQAAIEQWQMSVTGRGVVVAVEIPATKVQGHHASTGFDQSTGHQEMLEIPRSPVAVVLRTALAVSLTHRRILLRQIQCIGQAAGCENIQRLPVQIVETGQ